MRFFERQVLKRQQSLLLLLCFVAALLGMAALIHGAVVGFSYVLGQTRSLSEPSVQAIVMIALVWLTVLAGGFFRFLDVRAGGAMLARRFGAVRASDRSRYEKEQQLINVVAELGIASSTPQPDVFVLRREASINAFVLGVAREGKGSRRPVIVVTQGALDELDREQLQAMVAHEYAHIANGDLPLNMRLLIVLGGLMAIDEVGRWLVGRNPRQNTHPGVIVGYLLRALGSIGVFFGQLIQSAFSRQREYLADASAVQYTRNPFALAALLSRIKQQDAEPPLHNIHVQELAHICFQARPMKRWLGRLFASHPKLDLRIAAIDPHFSVKQRKAKRQQALSQTLNALTGTAEQSMNSTPPVEHVSAPPRELSDRIRLLLSDQNRCLAALFAIFAQSDTEERQKYLSAVAFAFNKPFATLVTELLNTLPDELLTDQLGIIEHASEALKQSVPLEDRQRLVLKLERLLSVRGDYQLMDYATIQLIRRKLEVEFPVLESVAGNKTAQGRRVKSFDAMGGEFALLLSLMVESSGASQRIQDEEFQRVLKCYTQTLYPRRTGNETGIVAEVEAAFQTLYVQPIAIRQAFVQHCREIVQQDGYVARAERALLELFAASLGCDDQAA